MKGEKKMERFYRRVNEQMEFCFYVETTEPLTSNEHMMLRNLLADGFIPEMIASKTFFDLEQQKIIELGPRMNFATTYSTNLVAICHACGLTKVTRIEKSRRNILLTGTDKSKFVADNHDRMTEHEYTQQLTTYDSGITPDPVWTIPMIEKGPDALLDISGLPFDAYDRQRYYDYFVGKENRNPTCVEIYDLANADSDHSRHHAFSGKIIINGEEMPETLMEIVKSTLTANPDNSVIAFHDNASAIQGFKCWTLIPIDPGKATNFNRQKITFHPLYTAETHNFPSGVAPYPGAETGLGGWIRDAVNAGRGSLVLFALAGYCVGRLCIPDYPLPWEEEFTDFKYPDNLASGLKIAIRASDGVSDYGNCFGVPLKGGFFRSFGARMNWGERLEFIKPIVYVGGGGVIDDRHIKKTKQ